MPVENRKKIKMPVLPLRGIVQFPGMALTLDVARKRSIRAISAAMGDNQLIFLAAQTDIAVDEPKKDDLYGIGCVCRIRHVLKVPDGGVKLLVEGLYRAELEVFCDSASFIAAEVSECEPEPIKNRAVYCESLIRRIRTEFEKYFEEAPNIARDVLLTVAKSEDLGYLSDFIAFNIPAPFDDKQYVLEQTSPVKRAKVLLELLSKEREIMQIDNRIGEKTRRRIDDNQREYYLKEQIRAISDELYGDDSADEIDEYYAKIDALKAKDEVKERLLSEVSKLAKMPQGAHEGTVVRNWLDTCLALPWEKTDNVKTDITRAERILDRDFYGMKRVKERILEMLSVYALAPDITGQILCLVGPPGVGKTSVGKTIAECMGRSFARISLGGMHDEAEIRGHRKTYIGAMPGRLITAVKQAGTKNPLILLDEIDKLGSDYKGDPSSALLEVLDPEQNVTFTDNFIELPFDLSHVVFITTANSRSTIPGPLLDRMELIEIEGYTREEKFNIAKKHLLPRELKRHGLDGRRCRVSDGAIYGIIDFYTREAGVRKLERSLASLCAKAAKSIASGEAARVSISAEELEKMLGKRRYKPEAILEHDEVGVINGLAWTSVGGEIMQLEIAAMKGTGKLELTGSLGDVMKESARAAVSFVRANAARYGIDEDFYKNTDIHIHATEAAVPKDGPSAGVTITTGLISALTGREVRRDVAMTGEITIRGRVLPIGGLKEKAMAAARGGVKTVFIPQDNVADLDEVDSAVKEKLTFVPVSYVGEIIDSALRENGESQEKSCFCPPAGKPAAAVISQ